MKKTYSILWLLMMSMALTAAEISQQQAMDNARSFMLQKKGGRTAAARARKTINMHPAETGMPELYAFNTEGGGYVIASADDRTLPVLGYSPAPPSLQRTQRPSAPSMRQMLMLPMPMHTSTTCKAGG